MVLTGYYEHGIDEKNRLAIPAKLRNRLDLDREGPQLVLVPSRRPRTLCLYTERQFDAMSTYGRPSLLPDTNLSEFESIYFSIAEHLDLDSQGRVVIPDRLLRPSGLGREVVVCGVRDHIEIRSREDFYRDLERYQASAEEIQARALEALRRAEAEGRQPGR